MKYKAWKMDHKRAKDRSFTGPSCGTYPWEPRISGGMRRSKMTVGRMGTGQATGVWGVRGSRRLPVALQSVIGVNDFRGISFPCAIRIWSQIKVPRLDSPKVLSVSPGSSLTPRKTGFLAV